ncbi:beta-xylosidase [Streptomyces sp. V4I23]|uniref:beta-xylosidase family glycoside hydrolase n=1 Tax=Streptomyces sp. V4I23 TaxID=3042282 RepID=UPI0027803657|nr:hypothetical protein [Streptomyces sp. V4I23]MDQ1006944.1 beta-xylosidase [Streptomyces sp. V4I23]
MDPEPSDGPPVADAAGPRCPLGRETAIQALTWDEDGWLRLRHGGWHPAVEVEVDVPKHPDAPVPRPACRREPLGWPWNSPRAAPDQSWADTDSRPGWIRLSGRHGPESLWAHSLQRITEHRAEAEVTVEARPHTFTQAAALVLWHSRDAYLSLDLPGQNLRARAARPAVAGRGPYGG